METQTALTRNGGQFSQMIRIVRFIAPAVATVLIGWGTVQFSQGRNAQRLDNVEKAVEKTVTREEFQTWAVEFRETLRSTNQKQDQLITREEFRSFTETFTEANRDQFRELKEDLRALKR